MKTAPRPIVDRSLPVVALVGRPNVGVDAKGEGVVGHVLGPFAKAEQKELAAFLDILADAVEDILRHGLTYAMNRHNGDGRYKAGGA